MVLLISSWERADAGAGALSRSLGLPVQCAGNLAELRAMLRKEAPAAAIVDQSSVGFDLAAAEALLNEQDVMIVPVNLALSDAGRMHRAVESALRRAQRDRAAATATAARRLRAAVKADLTDVLVAAELALRVPMLPAAAEAKLRGIHEAAERMRQQLNE